MVTGHATNLVRGMTQTHLSRSADRGSVETRCGLVLPNHDRHPGPADGEAAHLARCTTCRHWITCARCRQSILRVVA